MKKATNIKVRSYAGHWVVHKASKSLFNTLRMTGHLLSRVPPHLCRTKIDACMIDIRTGSVTLTNLCT